MDGLPLLRVEIIPNFRGGTLGPLGVTRSQLREGFFELVKLVLKRSQRCAVGPISECGALRTLVKVDCAAHVLTGRFQLRAQFVVLGVHDRIL